MRPLKYVLFSGIVAILLLTTEDLVAQARVFEGRQPTNAIQKVLWRLVRQQETWVDTDLLPRRPPRGYQPCGALYPRDANVRRIIAGPTGTADIPLWERESLSTVRRTGLPLPVCFEWDAETLTTNQGRFVLHINNLFIREIDDRVWHSSRRRHCHIGINLTGYTDPVERDTTRARQRAGYIRSQSVEPAVRYGHGSGPVPSAAGQAEFRRVRYSILQAQPCQVYR
jgi:hypothetical protein